jgi:hypothetical protein
MKLSMECALTIGEVNMSVSFLFIYLIYYLFIYFTGTNAQVGSDLETFKSYRGRLLASAQSKPTAVVLLSFHKITIS